MTNGTQNDTRTHLIRGSHSPFSGHSCVEIMHLSYWAGSASTHSKKKKTPREHAAH